MHLGELTGRRVVLLGLGEDVASTIGPVLAAGPAEVRVVEDRVEVLDPLIGPEMMATLDEAARWGEVFVRSPGFPRYQAPLVEALGTGASMTTPLDLWMGTHGSACTVVGVTGTKGKSTVTALVAPLAATHGIRVGVAGNLGPPVFSDRWDRKAPVAVLEVSSYQASDLHHVPDLGVLTHMAEDHLSWHGGVDRYRADKLRLFRNEGGTVGSALVAESSPSARGALAEMGIDAVVVPTPTGPLELPPHRVANAALAVEVVHRLGGPTPTPEAVLEAAASSMPGRLDPCPCPPGLLCLDDALASNPTATAAALAWLRKVGRPTIVLVGGVDRNVDATPLAAEVALWPQGRLEGVALADTGSDLARRCGLDLIGAAESVAEATAIALERSGSEGVILFSPAAPTPARIGNWETRSQQFRAALI